MRTLAEQAHENVRAQRTFVCFVENDDTIAIEIAFIK